MLELNKDNFEEEVLNGQGHILVDFWSPTCQPCKALLPEIEKLAKAYGDKVKFTTLDITKARRLAIGQKVLGLPVIAIYKDGERIDSLVGDEANKKAIEEMITKYA